MTYQEKLKDPRWQKKRLKILERDSFTCQYCKDITSTLHVHHRWYEKNTEVWDYPDEAFETLCEHCHNESGNKNVLVAEINGYLRKLSTLELRNLSIQLFLEYETPILDHKQAKNIANGIDKAAQNG